MLIRITILVNRMLSSFVGQVTLLSSILVSPINLISFEIIFKQTCLRNYNMDLVDTLEAVLVHSKYLLIAVQ